MGMYDTVNFNCPHCNEITSEQFKAREQPLLSTFTFPEVPYEILDNLTQELLTCENCGGTFI